MGGSVQAGTPSVGGGGVVVVVLVVEVNIGRISSSSFTRRSSGLVVLVIDVVVVVVLGSCYVIRINGMTCPRGNGTRCHLARPNSLFPYIPTRCHCPVPTRLDHIAHKINPNPSDQDYRDHFVHDEFRGSHDPVWIPTPRVPWIPTCFLSGST